MTKCIESLERAGVQFEIIPLEQSVHSVRDVEIACKCKTEEVIKTLLLIGNEPVMVVLPGDKKADMEKIKRTLSETSLRMATKDEVLNLTGYTVGSVTPFGINPSVKQIADESVLLLTSLILGSGKSDVLIKLNQSEFGKAFQGTFAPIATLNA